MWRMSITICVKGASSSAFEVRTSRDAIPVPLLQKTLYDAVHIHSSHQNGTPRRAGELKVT